MKTVVALLIICISTYLGAQTKEPDAFYSHLAVTVEGYPCTSIARGVVQDAGGAHWLLPENIVLPHRKGIPCPAKQPSYRDRITLTVTAVASAPGAILAKPGVMSMVSGDTAGWLGVKTDGIAKPGLSLDEQCQTSIHESNTLMSYVAGGSPQKLVQILSSNGIDVYVDEIAIDDAIQNKRFDGFFLADLFFVFRNEAVRQQAIASISANMHYAKPLSSLKYVRMTVAYHPKFLDGHVARPNGETIVGPVMEVHASDYIEPIRCTTSGLYRELQNKLGDVELIATPGFGSRVPTLIVSEGGFLDDCTNCVRWSLFAGDLNAIRTVAGYGVIRLDAQRTPFLMEVVEAMERHIADAGHKIPGNNAAQSFYF